MTQKPEVTTTPPKLVTVRGREISIGRPTEGQLVVWSRILQRLQRLGGGETDMTVIADVAGRTYQIVESLLTNKADQLWLEDQLIEGVDLQILADLIHAAAQVHGDTTAAPSTGPAPRKRAARRA